VTAVAVAAGTAPNTRGRVWQDRWLSGQSHRGTWLVLADGIGGGPYGERAAEAAVQVAARALAATALDEVAVASAVDSAHAAVQPWYPDARGGTTLSIVTITEWRLVAATVGDSPVLSVAGGSTCRLSPPAESGGLRSWVGSSEPVMPWLGSWPLTAELGVLVCSDGVAADGVAVPESSEPREWVDVLLGRHRSGNGDDATVVAAAVRPAPNGHLGPPPGRSQ
jgi:hypothetical protein